MKIKITLFCLLLATSLALSADAQTVKDGGIIDVAYYYPDTNTPPGPPPNYNMVDSIYFQGVPELPDPLDENAGGYYIFNDTAAGKWYIANFIYSKGTSLEQFHGSILATMDQPPTPYVNVWPQGFELTADLIQNDRWGWVKWPEEIAPNLYEIWWDITVDYAKLKDTGDYRDTLGISVAGCAIDFNIYASGHGDPRGIEEVYLGANKTRLSDVPGFTDTYEGIYDQYDVEYPESDPNTSVFTSKTLPGATYNRDGLVTPEKCGEYGETYAGSWAYQANGIQFSTIFCPPTLPPNFVQPPSTTDTVVVCSNGTVYDTIIATDPNPEDILTVTLLSGSGNFTAAPGMSPVTGYYEFEPAVSGTYTATFKVTDNTGEADTLTLVYVVSLNTAPVVSLGSDISVTVAPATQLCYLYSITDAENNVTLEQLYGGQAVIDTAANQLCFTPATSGNYQFIVRAEDACGLVKTDTLNVRVTVFVNTPPVANAGADQTLFLCAPEEICWEASCSDIDGNLASCELISGPGTYSGGQICFTPTIAGTYEFILRAVDTDGATDEDAVTITVAFNSAPMVVLGADGTVNLDAPAELCYAFTATDVDNNITSVTSNIGTINGGQVCFTADHSGGYQVILTATDVCGFVDADTINISVVISVNTPPVANAGADQTLFLCAPEEICWEASCSDIDGNLANCELISGPGTYSGGQICFTPTIAGTYEFVLRATDTDGATDEDAVTITVAFNSAPMVVLGADGTVNLDAPAELCYAFTATDVDNNITSVTSNIGTLNAGQVCFTAGASGEYKVIVTAIDQCGFVDADTINISVVISVNTPPVADAGADQTLFLCAPEEICWEASCSDIDGNLANCELISGPGTYSGGQICFTPTIAGTYEFVLRATDTDGATDEDAVTITVAFNSAPVVVLGADETVNLDAPAELCYAFTATDVNNNITSVTSNIGTINGGQVCFTAGVSGDYKVIVTATDVCGFVDADTINVSVVISVNTPPVANAGADQTLLIAEGQSLCWDASCFDVDGNLESCDLISPVGAYDGSQICFTPDHSGQYLFIMEAIDSDGASDRDTAIMNITINTDPAVSFGEDVSVILSQPILLTYAYTIIDPDDNVILEELLSVPGTIDTAANAVSFMPDAPNAGKGGLTTPSSTVYQLIVRASDALAGSGVDTLNVTVTYVVNTPPVANAGADQTWNLCAPQTICWTASCSDIDGNLASCQLISPAGTYDGSQICFVPDHSGQYTFIIQATDSDGAVDADTAVMTVALNSAPVCAVPPNSTFTQCIPAAVSLPVSGSDPDGNFDHCEILEGPGTLTGGNWVYTPAASGTVKVKIICYDACAASDVDSFTVAFSLNTPPVVNAGADFSRSLCAPETICRPVSVTGDDIAAIQLVSGPGSFDQGSMQICFTPGTTDATYRFILEATDNCGATDRDTVLVTVDFNRPPVFDMPSDVLLSTYTDDCSSVCIPIKVSDPDGDPVELFLVGHDLPSDYLDFDFENLRICLKEGCDHFTSGDYMIALEASDGCATDIAWIHITMVWIYNECLEVHIEEAPEAFPGQIEPVDIYLDYGETGVGGFDFLLTYDQSAVIPADVTPGPLLTSCGWEYFTYRLGLDGNCGGCPSGILRVTAIAETNNGAYHPSCFLEGASGPLATIDFLVSSNTNLDCAFVPINFLWVDCGDNTASDISGDSLWVSHHVYTVDHTEITQYDAGLPSYLGVDDSCILGDGLGAAPRRCINFTNGGIHMACLGPTMDRGDINLNEVAYEVADAVLFANYFIYGLSVFNIDQNRQVAATDINGDGLTLSVADLVYLTRIVVGDAAPVAKYAPGGQGAVELSLVNGILSIETSDAPVGALSLVIRGEAVPQLNPTLEGIDIRYAFDGSETRVLVYDPSGRTSINPGAVLQLSGDAEVTGIDAASYDGFVMTAKFESAPNSFALNQNYPNPFNPLTTIEFSLPTSCEWTLEIHNVLGVMVEKWNGTSNAGHVKVEWDASKYASGVYFYRLRAGEFSDTKKLVLLK